MPLILLVPISLIRNTPPCFVPSRCHQSSGPRSMPPVQWSTVDATGPVVHGRCHRSTVVVPTAGPSQATAPSAHGTAIFHRFARIDSQFLIFSFSSILPYILLFTSRPHSITPPPSNWLSHPFSGRPAAVASAASAAAV